MSFKKINFKTFPQSGYAFSGSGTDRKCVSTTTSKDKEGNFLPSVPLSNTRYFTYGALCLVTCIVSQRSTGMAAALGAVVAAYVGASEYFLSTLPKH